MGTLKRNMDWIRLIFLMAVFLFIGVLIGIKITAAKTSASAVTSPNGMVKEIGIEEYRDMLVNNEKAVVLISRASCRFCAIVDYLILRSADGRLPIYHLDMERYYLYPEYAEIKEELGIDYVPTIFYIENGSVKYAMNSPLDVEYYENKTADELAQIRQECVDKINAFIDGCIGAGPVINEEIKSGGITAVPMEGSNAQTDD